MNAYFLLMNSKRCITLTEAERATRHEEVGEGFSFIYSFIFRGWLAYLIIIWCKFFFLIIGRELRHHVPCKWLAKNDGLFTRNVVQLCLAVWLQN